MSMLFAATYPERTRAPALYGSYAHYLSWVFLGAQLEAFIATCERSWGTGESVRFFMPSRRPPTKPFVGFSHAGNVRVAVLRRQ